MERCMLCHTMNEKRAGKLTWPQICEVKEDGARILIYKLGNTVTLRTRQGKLYHKLVELKDAIRSLPGDFFLDGELLFSDYDRKTSNGIANKSIHNTISPEEASLAHVVIWDMAEYKDISALCGTNAFSYPMTKASERLKNVYTLLSVNNPRLEAVLYVYAENMEEVQNFYDICRKHGKEGAVIKDPDAPYEFRRSPYCLKMKAVETCDLRVIGMKEGTGKASGMMGSLHCVSDDGKIDVWVGSGFDDYQRQLWWSYEDKIESGDEPQPIIEVKYNELIKDKRVQKEVYSLFLPIFVSIRDDKDTTSTLEELKG
jgi:ATP-dependent DNA ligase